jgi:UDP-glucose 4-epimerase
MKILVTGCAGFIGSHFAKKLLATGHKVTGVDDLSFGSMYQMQSFISHPKFRFFKKNLLDLRTMHSVFKGQELVIHLAANSDILKGLTTTDQDLKLNTLGTYSVLEAMRRHGVKKILFASTSAVYGEAKKIPTPEDYGPVLPISLYGASKLACEGLLSAYAHIFGIQSWIFRFGNVIGPHLTHGVIFDFLKKLSKSKRKLLPVLGNGQQKKSYIHVQDCMDGMWYGFKNAREDVNVFNLSSGDTITVKEIAFLTKKYFGIPETKINFEKKARGWAGDVVEMRLAIGKMKRLGWQVRYGSWEAMEKTLQELCSAVTGGMECKL